MLDTHSFSMSHGRLKYGIIKLTKGLFVFDIQFFMPVLIWDYCWISRLSMCRLSYMKG